MVRKDYPFNKRELNIGTNLISSFFAMLITLPFSMLGNASSSIDSSCDGYTELYKPLKPCRLIVGHSLCGFFFMLSPILLLFLIDLNWWVFLALVVTILYQILFFGMIIELVGFTFDMEEYYIFNRFDIKKQINACKFTLNLWTIIFTAHSVFFLGYNIMQWWAIATDFKYNHWEGYSSYIHYVGCEFLLKIKDVSTITALLIVVILIINIALATYCYRWRKNILKKISKNPSVREITKCTKRVDSKILCELFDRAEGHDKLTFNNGCCLKRINHSNILECGFSIIDKSGKEINVCFRDYTQTYIGLLKNGRDILKKMAKDINSQLQIHDIDYSIQDSVKNRKTKGIDRVNI